VRLLRRLVLGLLEVALALYDLVIFLPLFIERLLVRLGRRARS
jgi:hypothetical protein